MTFCSDFQIEMKKKGGWRERQKKRESRKRMWLSLSPSKPEVQVRVCRSFLCRLNLLLPIFCLTAFISLSFLCFLSHSLAVFMCLSCVFYSSLTFPRFNPPTFEVKVQEYVDLILDWKQQDVVWSILPGDSITAGGNATALSPWQKLSVSHSSLWTPASADGWTSTL